MDELVAQFTEKLGLAQQQGQEAIAMVMSFLKDKLPADLVNQIGAAVPDLGAVARRPRAKARAGRRLAAVGDRGGRRTRR